MLNIQTEIFDHGSYFVNQIFIMMISINHHQIIVYTTINDWWMLNIVTGIQLEAVFKINKSKHKNLLTTNTLILPYEDGLTDRLGDIVLSKFSIRK